MLTKEIKEALMGYTANMKNKVTFVVQTGEHEKRSELIKFLSDFAKVSDKINVEQRDMAGQLRSPVSFLLEVDDKANGIQFSGVPSGHEFNSLVLAVLHSSGTALKLDDSLKDMIASVREDLKFEVYVSLSCHNCPDVVQALNQFATINPSITTETIDGGVYPDLIEKNNIQGVPTVLLNGEVFANGKVDTAQLLDKLKQKYPNIGASKPEKALPLQDVTVIGGGPGGVSAAIYAARKGLKVTIIADRFGGQVKDTLAIENLISIPKTTGPELASALQAHLNEYDITMKQHFRVDRVEKGDIKSIHLSSGEVIKTKALIIASGAKWRELGVPGEKENIGNGVAYCPHCDGPFFKGKDIAVIGGGNSGIEAALDLASVVKSVTVFEFLPELKADSVLLKQVKARDNISIQKNVAVKQIIAETGKVTGIEYQSRKTHENHTKNLDGVFVQIGLLPNSGFLKGVVELSQYGEVVINERGQTSEAGIFACGDVTTVPYKQIIIAMGEGAKASLAAFDYLLMNATAEQLAA